MSHKRGQIVECQDIIGETYYMVFTGCEFIDAFYTLDTLEQATKISNKIQEARANG